MTTHARPSPAPRAGARSAALAAVVASIGALATAVILYTQLRTDQAEALDDLDRRAAVLVHRVAPQARAALVAPADDPTPRAALGDRLQGHARLLGLSVHYPDGRVANFGSQVGELAVASADLARQAAVSRQPVSRILRDPSGTTHAHASPLDDAGAVVAFHDAVHLDERLTRAILYAAASALAVGLGLFILTAALAWAMFERPLLRLAEWMRRLRFGNTPEQPPKGLPLTRLADESAHLAASFRAARSKEQQEAKQAVRSDKSWTRDRLRAHAVNALGGLPLVIVANREPYVHQFKAGKITVSRPAGGLVTGLDPVLRACGGMWVAQASGDADRAAADAAGCLPVPPDDPRYTLKRIWLSKQEEQGYYYGFSNEGLWPLCHLTHERPVFRQSDFEHYARANQRFADAVLSEIGPDRAVVLVQDYQLALVPALIKQKRPDMRVGLFWHIPICPYRNEILRGMLGADLIGFHLQQHCNNFLDTVDRMIEAKLDRDRFSAELAGHTALVRPFPISVQSWSERSVPKGQRLSEHIEELKKLHALNGVVVGVGVDRIDYTKGITERFRAIERLFERHPELIGRFTFVQLGAPSRTHIPRYRDMVTDLEQLADTINWKFRDQASSSDPAAPGWQAIRMLVDQHEGSLVYTFFKLAEVCVVSSLHDGMNLVAKEFVAAQSEDDDLEAHLRRGPGVLVLSEFAGAARDLPEALIINPYDTEQFAAALHEAITMPPAERTQRMTRMAQRVEENNIYRWAADFLTTLAQTQPQAQTQAQPQVRPVEPPAIPPVRA
jgi:trehalose 6-phosphate synthase